MGRKVREQLIPGGGLGVPQLVQGFGGSGAIPMAVHHRLPGGDRRLSLTRRFLRLGSLHQHLGSQYRIFLVQIFQQGQGLTARPLIDQIHRQ
jgi:hypothetical protein